MVGTPMDEVGPIRRFIIEHDDKWLFTVLYIGAAVILSIWISLFWLIAVVGVHFAFELVRSRHRGRAWAPALGLATWEIKLDIALVFFALALGVYMDVLLGVAGLQGAARVGANAGRAIRGGTRFAVWERVLRGVLLTVDDAAQVARAAARARGKANGDPDGDDASDEDDHDDAQVSPWRSRWGLGDRLTIGFGLACVALLFVAPWLTDHDAFAVISILGDELHPWPSDGD